MAFFVHPFDHKVDIASRRIAQVLSLLKPASYSPWAPTEDPLKLMYSSPQIDCIKAMQGFLPTGVGFLCNTASL